MPLELIHQYIDYVSAEYDRCLTKGKKLFFRGHADRAWELLPSVFRRSESGIRPNERELILDYKQVSVSEMNYRDKIENLLVEMQHHCMPTRMLDWSLSPLVALYFACQSHLDKKSGEETDGAVYTLDPWEPYRKIYKSLNPHPELMDILKESRMLLAQKWDFDSIKRYIDRKYLYSLEKDALRAPIPFVGRYMVDRVVTQQSGFVIWGDGYEHAFAPGIHEPLNRFTEYQPYFDHPFKIPAKEKASILTWLRQMGIDSLAIFPDKEGIKREIEEVRSLFNFK